MSERELSEEQRLMRQSCRDFVDKVVLPFIRGHWQREWLMTPEERLPPHILGGAEEVGIRTLGVPEEFGGIELDKAMASALPARTSSIAASTPSSERCAALGETRCEARKVAVLATPAIRTPAALTSAIDWSFEPGATR